MSAESLPKYPHISAWTEEQYDKAVQNCLNKGHLQDGEDLREIIRDCEDILVTHGLTKDDIYQNHRNMYLKFYKLNSYYQHTSIYHGEHFKPLYENKIKKIEGFGRGWCGWGVTTNEINLNGQHLRITCFKWGGAEQCPLEVVFEDKYQGYKRGDRDWFVTNVDTKETIWIPDLLPAQIGMFGFPQGSTSDYHLHLEHYIRVMGINGRIEPLETYEVFECGYPNGPLGLDYFEKNYDIVKEVKEEGKWHYLLGRQKDSEDGEVELFLHLDNLKEIKNTYTTIDLDGFIVKPSNFLNSRDYSHFKKNKVIKLVEGDDTEEMKKIRSQQAFFMIAQASVKSGLKYSV